MPAPTIEPAIAFVGFGEAARAIASGWGHERATCAFDTKILSAHSAQEIVAAGLSTGTSIVAELGAALSEASVVFCLVTADQAAAAAAAAAIKIRPGTLWLDGNSCAPGTKRAAAAAIEGVGGRYVDVAIMAPILRDKHRTPMLLAGPHSGDAHELMRALGMNGGIAGNRVGDASAIKMIRSVMIKGMEALTAECLLAARRAGVEEAVLHSFQKSDPGTDWRRRSSYNLERMTAHGRRRSAEMREVALTLRELGLPDRMAAATAEWQEQIGRLDLDGKSRDLAAMADAILGRIG